MQPTDDSCMVTCIAMVIGKPVSSVYENYHKQLFNFKGENLSSILDKYGIPHFVNCSAITNTMHENNLFFLCVPSLNTTGGTHQILAINDNGFITIFDPAMGLEDTKYYVYDNGGHEFKENEVQLKSWLIDIVIPLVRK